MNIGPEYKAVVRSLNKPIVAEDVVGKSILTMAITANMVAGNKGFKALNNLVKEYALVGEWGLEDENTPRAVIALSVTHTF